MRWEPVIAVEQPMVEPPFEADDTIGNKPSDPDLLRAAG
jgi:hypothetical protein